MDKDRDVLNDLSSGANGNKSMALAIVTKSNGSSPGKEGAMMVVFEDGNTKGTLGGGNLEYKVIQTALNCIKTGKNDLISFDVSSNGSLGMVCGGNTDIFIKVFKANDQLIIIGGGHIAQELYKLGKMFGFEVVIFEDREQYGNVSRFPEAKIILGDYEKTLTNYEIKRNSYIVIVTRGHSFDEVALKFVINSEAAYIGMIGSKNKVSSTFNNLKKEGIEEKDLKKIYAPIGINTGGNNPLDIAFSIMTEILVIKNGGSLEHLKI